MRKVFFCNEKSILFFFVGVFGIGRVEGVVFCDLWRGVGNVLRGSVEWGWYS